MATASSSTKINQNDEETKKIEELSKEMLQATGDYIRGEIDVCIADYLLLEKMNRTVEDKYKNLHQVSSSISSEMEKLNEKYTALLPLLSQIDDVEHCIDELEQSATKLDSYSKRLEAKFKQFAEKNNLK